MATKKKKPPQNKPTAPDGETEVVEVIEAAPSSDDVEPAGSIGDLVAALGTEGQDRAEAKDASDDREAPADGDGDGKGSSRGRDASVELVSELPIDTDDDLSEVEGEASERLVSIVESLLFSASRPLTVKRIRKVLSDPTVRQVQLALKHLVQETATRGIVVSQVAGGFMLRTNPENAAYVQKLLQKRPIRLSRPQLETMAIIAYRQPTTRAEIDHVRGVDSGGTLKVLLERDLIKIVGRREEVGRPMLYGTTVHFLEFFNLQSLRDLPDLREFRELSVETKARLKKDMDDTEVEALGQEVIEFSQQVKDEAERAAEEQRQGEQGDADQAEGDQAEPEQSESDQAEPEQAESDQAESDQAEPDQSESDQSESQQVEGEAAQTQDPPDPEPAAKGDDG